MENIREKKPSVISEEELREQRVFAREIAAKNAQGTPLYYYIQTFGCQQNEADSERLAGMCEEMGYLKTDTPETADLILVNTCAVRGHAEERAYSITGQFKHLKERKPSLVIAICGCMVSVEKQRDTVKHRYPYISILFGTSMLYRFPEILYTYFRTEKRQFFLDAGDAGNIAEGIPVVRGDDRKAWVSIMYGCNNFCSYCIVPYVRGRERSRNPEDIIAEITALAQDGYREITLLGQNVNSYGRDREDGCDFPTLLERVCAVEGDFRVSFMTSHPKDATRRLIDVMASNPKIAHRFHLPLQSGSNRVLGEMNRHYTWESYSEILSYLREKIPDVTVTSDIIVGFPTETEEDFADTVRALTVAQYDQVYSFIYSPREGTPAARMEQLPDTVKSERMTRLLETQNEIALSKNKALVGKTFSVLVEGRSKNDKSTFAARTEGGKLIHFTADDGMIGTVQHVRVTEAEPYCLLGELVLEE